MGTECRPNVARHSKGSGMKLLFDARWIKPDSPDGITRYSRELIKQLAKKPDFELSLLITSKNQLEGLPKLKTIVSNSPSSKAELSQAKKLNPKGFDIVYTPHFIFGGKDRRFKLVRTVHDLIPFRDKTGQRKLVWRIFYSSTIFLKRILNASDGIVTVSETVRDEVAKICTLPIEVVYNAPAELRAKTEPQKSKELLYIGRYTPHKNVKTLIAAMDQLPGYKLLLAGNCSDEQKRELLANAKNPERIIFMGIVSDEEYAEMLQKASCLVTASFDEGFGLPLVEAMQAGCPVVCSNIEVFHEVAGDAALYFNPNDSKGLVKQVKKLEQAKTHHQQSQLGIERAKYFSWQSSGNRLQSFLSEITQS